MTTRLGSRVARRPAARGAGGTAPLLLALVGLFPLGCKGSHAGPAPALSSLQPSKPFRFPQAPRVVAIGDLHGDLDATKRALRLAGAIDSQGRWSGGKLVVVQTGDELDRADDDREILELFDRLAVEAAAAGGSVHALNGNHEQMNVAGDFRYVTEGAMKAFAEPSTGPTVGRRHAFAPGGVYAKRLAERNTIVVVGDTAFVHGGILPEHAPYVGAINEAVRLWMRGEIPRMPDLAMSQRSPVWIRDLSEGQPSDRTCQSAREALRTLGVSRLVVGHTIQEMGINAACGGQVWRIDVGMSRFYGHRPVQVLELKDGQATALREDLGPSPTAPSRPASPAP
jgi:hypothetical protein